MTQNDMFRYSRAVQGAESEESKKKIRYTGARLLKTRLDLLTELYSEKIEPGLAFPRNILQNTVYGYDCWGTTYSGWLMATRLTSGNPNVPIPIPIDEHQES